MNFEDQHTIHGYIFIKSDACQYPMRTKDILWLLKQLPVFSTHAEKIVIFRCETVRFLPVYEV